jgi:mercuric ion transport protein
MRVWPNLPHSPHCPPSWAPPLAAIGASVCCVVPLVLVLMGISGAWIANLTALDAWRPWFSAATLVCLGWAFWMLYGPAARCRTDGACVEPALIATPPALAVDRRRPDRSAAALPLLHRLVPVGVPHAQDPSQFGIHGMDGPGLGGYALSRSSCRWKT